MHLSQQQETLYIVEVRNSKWAENEETQILVEQPARWLCELIVCFSPMGIDVFMESEENKLKSWWLDDSAELQRMYMSGWSFISRGQCTKQESIGVSFPIAKEVWYTNK